MNTSQQYVCAVANQLLHVPLPYQFLAKHGQSWFGSEHFPYGEPRECFRNSLLMAMENDWHYAEGWATASGLIPLQHAWCVRPDGSIVDPTWPRGVDYFGAVFSFDFVQRLCGISGYYGIFENLYLVRKKFPDLVAHLESGLVSV